MVPNFVYRERKTTALIPRSETPSQPPAPAIAEHSQQWQWVAVVENEGILTPAPNNCDDISVKRATPTSTHSFFSLMPVDPPFNVYRDQITALSQGLALWNPNPPKRIYNNVSIGDVGYLHEGTFIRMFNVMLPWDHPSNRTLGVPEFYEPLDVGPFTNTLEGAFDKVEHYSRNVTAETNAGNTQALSPEQCVIFLS